MAGHLLQSCLDHTQVGEKGMEQLMGLRTVTSGKVRTEQRSPIAGGDIFGQRGGVAAPDCQPLLCRSQG